MNERRYRDAERRLWRSVRVQTTERWLHLDRVGTTVRIQETGEGPPVVFVHGATNGGTSWAPLVAHLPGFRCLLLDRPGCGLNDALPTRFRDIEALGRFADAVLVDVLDALGCDRADVVATSFGGSLALRAAASHPQRFRRQVQFGCPFGAARVPASVRIGTVPGSGRLAAAVPLDERLVRAMLRHIGLREALEHGRVSPEMLGWYTALLRDTLTLRNELSMGPRLPLFGSGQLKLLPPDLLACVRTPSSLLWGDGDPFGGPDAARSLAAALPDAELEIMPGAGHAVWMDDAEHAAGVVRRFLGR